MSCPLTGRQILDLDEAPMTIDFEIVEDADVKSVNRHGESRCETIAKIGDRYWAVRYWQHPNDGIQEVGDPVEVKPVQTIVTTYERV